MGKVATLVNRCLREDQHLCDVADDLNSSIMVKMDVLPNEEKANQATSLAILKGFV